MQIINRKGHYNDVMFGDMAEFAQHQIKTSPYKHHVVLEVNGQDVAEIEDVRIIFTKPSECQAKARVAVADKHITFDKKATVKLKITGKAPSLEPATTITVTEWYEETSDFVPGMDKAPVVITPNKWIYFKGTK